MDTPHETTPEYILPHLRKYTPEETREINARWIQMWVDRLRKINRGYAKLERQIAELQEHIDRQDNLKRG